MSLGNARLSRTLALLLTIAVGFAACMFVWTLAGAPLARGAGRIQAVKNEIAFLQSAKTRLGEVGRWSEVRTRAQTARADFLIESSPVLAAAALQASMRKAAQDAGLEVISAQDSIFDGDTQKGVSIQMVLAGEFSGLAIYLATLAEMTPVVLVDEIEVRAQGSGGKDDNLAISMTGTALLWREGDS